MGKRIKGRKRHILVDTLGLLLGVHVTPASTTERDGAQGLLSQVLGWFTWLRLLWVDGGYQGDAFAKWVKGVRPNLSVEVVKRSDGVTGFKLLPRRWVVERTFGWLVKARRLTRDHERNPRHHEALVYMAMIGHSARHLTAHPTF